MNDYLKQIKQNINENQFLGQVCAQYRNLYAVIVNGNEILAEVSGKFIYSAKNKEDYPTVGDYILLDRKDNKAGNAIIEKVIERKSIFKRKNHNNGQNEILASNIDYVFICMALNNDFNLRRLERYISVCYETEITPIVVLTKSDLCVDITEKLIKVENVAIGLDILVLSNKDEDYTNSILNYLKEDTIACFVGSSEVGKST